jgi:hypothetical protein
MMGSAPTDGTTSARQQRSESRTPLNERLLAQIAPV